MDGENVHGSPGGVFAVGRRGQTFEVPAVAVVAVVPVKKFIL